MNVIFLDIDGVMNNQEDWLAKVDSETEEFRGHRMFCDGAWQMLSQVCRETGAKVVLSSSWRMGLDIAPDGTLVSRGGPMSDKLLEYFSKYEIELIGKTTNYYDHRGRQIKEYVKNELKTDDNWIVLDDEDVDIRGYVDKSLIFKTTFEKGLTDKHCKKIISYFKENTDE